MNLLLIAVLLILAIALAVVAYFAERRPYTEEQQAFFAKMEAQMREDMEEER
jgi:Tfp pilus assembly protein PilV